MKINLSILLCSLFLVKNVYSGAVQLSSQNFDSIVGNSELVFINFYAGWCRFSQMLEPIWDEFANNIQQKYKTEQVVVAKLDADTEKMIAVQNAINKYPTLKLYRYGVSVKREYRGARSAEAFENFIKEQLVSSLQVVETVPDFMQIEQYKKKTIIGYFENKDNDNYKTYLKLSSILRDSCGFVAAIGKNFENKRLNGDNIILADPVNDIQYTGSLINYQDLYTWTHEVCTPTVRKITFENAEELTEEGLPFLILFHHPDDTESVSVFEKEVKRQLIHLKHTINPVAADGLKFSHPLHHLGKSANDLPVIAIDSFKHMYLYPDYKQFSQGENLKQFIIDLNSGKLHREFHNGPDPALNALPNVQFEIVVNPNVDHIPKLPEVKDNVEKKTNPPESVFIKLAPSSDRYTAIRHGDGGEF